jgi:hypothetical protein
LVRGRFLSRPVLSLAYRRILVRYIDQNPVRAGICGDAREHDFGSAACYARAFGPPWLERSWVEEQVRSATRVEAYRPADYPRVFGTSSPADSRLVERRLGSLGRTDPLDDLVHATPDRVLAWMRWKARLADGTEPGIPLVDPACVDSAVIEARSRGIAVLLEHGKVDGLRQLHAGLLRQLCGESLRGIAVRIGRSTSTSGAFCQNHDRRLHDDEAYAVHASSIARDAIQAQHGIPYRVNSSGHAAAGRTGESNPPAEPEDDRVESSEEASRDREPG